jgi:hypothetical protein
MDGCLDQEQLMIAVRASTPTHTIWCYWCISREESYQFTPPPNEGDTFTTVRYGHVTLKMYEYDYSYGTSVPVVWCVLSTLSGESFKCALREIAPP